MLAFLENLRTTRLNACAIMIQKNLKANYYRRRYLEARESIIALQALSRGFCSRMRAEETRQIKAASRIQRVWRGSKERKSYRKVISNIVLVQALFKGFLRRRQIMDTRLGNAATVVQRAFRQWRSLRAFRQYRKKVVIIQSLHRGRKARKQYKSLREEARDLKQISYKLENKVVELTQSLGTLKRENKTLVSQLESYEGQLKSFRSRHTALESRSRELQAEANQAGITAARLAALEEDHARLQASQAEHMGNANRLQEEEKALRQSLRSTTAELEKVRQSNAQGEKEKTSLRQQITELQDQLELAKRAAPVMNGVQGESQNGNVVPPANGLINLVSSKKPKRRSAGATERVDADRTSAAYNPRPVSMAIGDGYSKNLANSTFIPGAADSVEAELGNLLAAEDELNEEVTVGLIKNLKIPVPGAIRRRRTKRCSSRHI